MRLVRFECKNRERNTVKLVIINADLVTVLSESMHDDKHTWISSGRDSWYVVGTIEYVKTALETGQGL